MHADDLVLISVDDHLVEPPTVFDAHLPAPDEPTVSHCAAGKDRTGSAAALVLHALGASHEEVMRDYLLTNQRLKPPATAWRELPPEVAAVLWGVQSSFLEAAYEAVEREHGSMEAYLREGLGLRDAEQAQLQALYLER